MQKCPAAHKFGTDFSKDVNELNFAIKINQIIKIFDFLAKTNKFIAIITLTWLNT